MKRFTLLMVVSLLAAAGCGGDDDDSADEPGTTAASPAQRCIDSWNADANEPYQTTLAGAISASGAAPDELRVGTWPKSAHPVEYVNAEDAFAGRPVHKSTVPRDACLIVMPPSQAGEITFFEDQGGWRFARTAEGRDPEGRDKKFPLAAKRATADAETATADALGKLTLN